MCTDNMPVGSAMALGDVLTIHGGKTVEVMNTDAEGRLVMADALVLATEEQRRRHRRHRHADRSGLRALGHVTAGVLGNDAGAGRPGRRRRRDGTDEPVWELPLDQRYRKELDSDIADMKNLGGDTPARSRPRCSWRSSSASMPWAHIDIAGTAHVEADDSWRSKGATGFGARLLIDSHEFRPDPGLHLKRTTGSRR